MDFNSERRLGSLRIHRRRAWQLEAIAQTQFKRTDPYFLYSERLSDNTLFTGLSHGGSRFSTLSYLKNDVHQPAFSVRKGYSGVFIRIYTGALVQFLRKAGLHFSLNIEYDVLSFFNRFSAIRARFKKIMTKLRSTQKTAWPRETLEIQLLVTGVLLDEAIFDGRSRDLLSPEIRRSMSNYKALLEIAGLESALAFPGGVRRIRSGSDYQVRRCVHHNSKGEPNLFCICAEEGLDNAMISPSDDGEVAEGEEVDDGEGDLAPRSLQLIKFRAYFYKSFSILEQHRTTDVKYCHTKVDDLSRLQMPGNPRNAWRLGFRVVRDLLRGQLPRNVHQVIFCVMMAHAMREEADCYTFTQEEFSRDLWRWRDALDSEEDRSLFERVSALLFNEQLPPKRLLERYEDNLSHFQELFQNLLSGMGLDELEFDWHSGTRLSVIQARHAEVIQTRVDIEAASDAKPDPKTSAHRSEIYTANWQAHDFRVMKLAATVIFCVVIAVCLAFYHPLAHTQAKRLMQTMLDGSSGPSEGHKRNCIFIACYIGLSQRTIESIPFGKSRKRPCYTCGLRITKGNFDRHLTTHDLNKKYKCERCGYKDNRSDNFAKHVRETCHNKGISHDLNEGLDEAIRHPHLAEGAQVPTSMTFLDIRQPLYLSNMGLGTEWPTPLQQKPSVPEQANPSLDLWSSSMIATFPPIETAQTPDISPFALSPWQSNCATADVSDQNSNIAFGHGPTPDACYPFLPDQTSIPQSSFEFDPGAWNSIQFNTNWEAVSRETMFGLDEGTASTTTPQAAANTMIDDPYLSKQWTFNLDQFLDDLLLMPDLGLNFSGQIADPFAHGNPDHLPTAPAPFLPFAGQPAYDASYQNSLGGSAKRKSPPYPSDDGSNRATRVKTGYASQSTWMDSFSS